MKRSSIFLLIVGLCLLWTAPLFAGSDEYLGDASIYAGIPTTMSRPNVLFIIDNSRATLHTASGRSYRPWQDQEKTVPNIYPQKPGCDGKEDARNGCYLPWNIYEQDNQGDFATKVLSTTSIAMNQLTCDPSSDSSKPIHSVFQNYGSYSGSGIDPFPNIKSDGTCDWKNNNSSGKVYAIGNYLNYTKNAEGDDRIGAPDPGDDVVVDPDDPCADLPPADVVSVSSTRNVCTKTHPNTGACQKYENVTTIGYFQALVTHTSSDANHPVTGTVTPSLWADVGGSAPPGTTPTSWASGQVYEKPVCEADPGDDTEDDLPENATQREIIYYALEKVIASTAGVVNFGALSYGGNNSGGKLLYNMADLSANVADSDISETVTGNKVFAPDCTSAGNANLPMCKFLAAIPGPGEKDGEPVLSSNTLRPQAESLLDAGYYYGAQYRPITIGSRIPDAMENVCGLNHVILLTNGFSNGDGSPRLSVVGDADGDNYANEEVYGLGSHWLDDVAKHLQENYGITTHTVLAFQTKDYLVENAAKDGEGEFYNVFNAEELAAALTKLLGNIINESSTSFVAPVVPSSTTNRTISSNKVYLGLFRPQQDGPWHGNIKKYGISPSTLQLTGADGTPATDIYGNFDDDSISYWSLLADDTIPTASTKSGYIDSTSTDPNKPHGDGGDVSAGGAGGVLLEKMNNLVAAIRDQGTWTPSGQSWRNIYTYLDDGNSTVDTPSTNLYAAQNHFVPSNTYITSDVLNYYNTDVSPAILRSSAETANLIRFVHGFVDDEDTQSGLPMTPATAEIRKWVLGDVLHSKPVVFNYSKYIPLAENQCYAFDGQPNLNANSSIIFAGANDGMLHAFRDCDGQELWAFIPPNALPSLQYLKNPQRGHATFVDSAPSLLVHDQNNNGTIEPDGGDKVVLVFGQRRGGGTNILDEDSSRGAYYALDVTNPLQPKYLWEVDSENLGEIGETWSQPRLAKVPVNSSSFKIVAFVGTGYDNNEDLRFGDTQTFPDSTDVDINLASPGGEVDGSDDPQTSSEDLTADNRNAPRGRGIMAIEVATLNKVDAASPYTMALPSTGTVYWSYTFADNDLLKYSFPGDLAVLDMNGDSYADTIYTGDTGGNLWKFDVGGADKNQWSGQMLFQSNAGADGSNGRKIFYRPEVAYVGAPHIYFGTGDREHPLNRAVVDRMYCVIDWGAQGTYPVNESALVDATANTLQDPDTTKEEADALLSKMLSSPWSPYLESGVSKFTYGWYIKLDGVDRTGDPGVLDLGEKVLAPATVFNGEVFFSTYQLQTGARAGCEAGNMGISRLYHLDYRTAEAVMNYNLSNDDLLDGTETDGETPAVNERSIGENGEILDRTDRTRDLGEGIPSGIVTLIDASGNVTQLISSSDKVEAMAAPDIKLISPVYWMQW